MNEQALEGAIEKAFDKVEKRKKSGLSDKEQAEVDLLKSVTGGMDPRRWTIEQDNPVDQS